MSENVGKCALNPRANCLFCLINSPVANLLVVADFHILEAWTREKKLWKLLMNFLSMDELTQGLSDIVGPPTVS